MPVRRKREPFSQALYELSTRHTILVPLLLLLIAVVFKILDVFVFGRRRGQTFILGIYKENDLARAMRDKT